MRKKSLVGLLLCLGLLLILLVGCGAESAKTDAAEEDLPTPVAEDSIYITLYLTDAFEEKEPNAVGGTEENDEPQENLTTAMVTSVDKDALSAQTIVEEYNRLIIETAYGRQLVVNTVQETGQQVKVDFDSESVEALEIEPGYEGQLFYNLARSIDDNLGDVDEIYFTMDGGKDFTLGHLWFEADRPFYSGIVLIEGEEGSNGEVAPE